MPWRTKRNTHSNTSANERKENEGKLRDLSWYWKHFNIIEKTWQDEKANIFSPIFLRFFSTIYIVYEPVPICFHLARGYILSLTVSVNVEDFLCKYAESIHLAPFFFLLLVRFHFHSTQNIHHIHTAYIHNTKQKRERVREIWNGFFFFIFATWEMFLCQRLRQLSFILPHPSINQMYLRSITWISYIFLVRLIVCSIPNTEHNNNNNSKTRKKNFDYNGFCSMMKLVKLLNESQLEILCFILERK